MKHNLFKKVMGMVLSIAMLAALAVPALADGPTTTGGSANILDYTVESVVVPTALKIALNPNGYTVTTKYVKTADAAVTEGKTYYISSGGGYSEVATPVVGSMGSYFEAVNSSDGVVSLNYGIANKSTEAKTVKVEFKANYTAAANKTAIVFVDSAAKAQAYNASTNSDGAKDGELKMYLEVAPASALPTADTYAKATTWASGTKYYKISSGQHVEDDSITDADTFATAAAPLVKTTTIGTEISAAELADITMTKATAGRQAFAAVSSDGTAKAKTSIAFKLGGAGYTLKKGEVIDFSTSQADLSSIVELTTLGGVAGFTITGKINGNADWTTAEASTITITPTYTIANATGSETAVANTYNVVSMGPGMTVTAGGAISITGLSASAAYKSLKITYSGTDYELDSTRATWSPSVPTAETTGNVSCQLASNWVDLVDGTSTTFTLTYTSGGTDQTIVKTVTISK